MVFMQNSGEVGATARMRIRGTSTLIGNREPLWVLDGIPLSDPVDVTNEQLNDPDYINYIGNAISGLNPQDIERVDVLKRCRRHCTLRNACGQRCDCRDNKER